jgi:hypothetical protein
VNFRGPDPTNPDARWSAFLTLKNAENVAAHLRHHLAGGFVWAVYNEGLPGLGLRVDLRELRPATREPSGVALDVDDDMAHITVCDSYGVWGLRSRLAEQPPWGPVDDEDLASRVRWATRISWDRSDSLQTLAYHVEQRVPAGHVTRWTVLPLDGVDRRNRELEAVLDRAKTHARATGDSELWNLLYVAPTDAQVVA